MREKPVRHGKTTALRYMRPDSLNPLFADITSLPGVGPKVAALISKVAGPRVIDLLCCVPTGLIDRSTILNINEVEDKARVTLKVTVGEHTPAPKTAARLPYKILCSDDTGFITLAFFHARVDYLLSRLPTGAERYISGKVERYSGGLQMVHPEYIIDDDKFHELPLFETQYPLTASLNSKVMRKAVMGAVELAPELSEWVRKDLLEQYKWGNWQDAITALHKPTSKLDASSQSVHRQRLAYDEMLANQLALGLIRNSRRKQKGCTIKGNEELRNTVLAALPFALTGDQKSALSEVYEDMSQPYQMVRLVQGDVGSGKTVVALLALLNAVEAGFQACLMAPTEILAQQHFDFIATLLEETNISIELLTGSDSGLSRKAKIDALKKGYLHIVIGTHALFSEDVEFSKLGLIVIDEQHRFGVMQRLALQGKGYSPDVLVMTATPIPRSLALTSYGDMEVSQIKEKPPGRLPVTTVAMPIERLSEVTAGISRAVENNEQVYWVCPMVEDTDLIDLTSVEHRYAELHKSFGDKVALIHGKMKQQEKDVVINRFYRGDISVLVATTVIEVGVNAPDATIIVVEHAERFGLAQLHQLRGRVGRGDKKSTCILLYKTGQSGKLSETSKARINILRQSEDGFEIAEEDLRLRGPGDFLGSAQSGFPDFRFADAAKDKHLLEVARDNVKLILNEDPNLHNPENNPLKTLLYLFGRDDAAKLLSSG